MIKKLCFICNKVFSVRKYREISAKYCSLECYWISKIGKKLSQEIKDKLSILSKGQIPWNKGKCHSEETKKKMSLIHKQIGTGKWMLGRKLSEETRRKIGKNQAGNKHWNYKDGWRSRREDINKWNKEWYKNKPNKRLSCQKRLSIKRLGGNLEILTIQKVYEDNIKQFGTLTCYLCLKPIEFRQDSLEHKIPLSRGGTNLYENLAIAHRSCNCKKHNKTEEEYRGTICPELSRRYALT